MLRGPALAAGVAAVCSSSRSFADLILVSDMREVSAYAAITSGGQSLMDGPHTQTPGAFGAPFDGSISAMVMADDGHNASALAEQTSSFTATLISAENHLHGHTDGLDAHALATSTVDMTFLVEAGTDVLISIGHVGDGSAEIRDSDDNVILTDGFLRRVFSETTRLRLITSSVVEINVPSGPNRNGVGGGTVRVIPGPAASSLLLLAALGAAPRRRRGSRITTAGPVRTAPRVR